MAENGRLRAIAVGQYSGTMSGGWASPGLRRTESNWSGNNFKREIIKCEIIKREIIKREIIYST
jgi:hypothetical protein